MDYSDLHPLVLRLLDAYEHGADPGKTGPSGSSPGRDPTEDYPATISVSGATYKVTSAEVDLLLQQHDGEGHVRAARLILSLAPTASSSPAAKDPHGRGQPSPSSAEVAAHAFVRRPVGGASPEPARVELILDADALARLPDGDGAAQRASLLTARNENRADSHAPVPRASPSPSPSPPSAGQASSSSSSPRLHSLAATYHAYIAAINARTLAHSLPDFCHPTVTHNSRVLSLATYRRLMEDAQDSIRELVFSVADLLVDEAGGMVAARLAFRGVAVGEFAGVRPMEGVEGGGVGREVRFGEVVFYWFEGGRIREVVSLVDLDAYRTQVTGQEIIYPSTSFHMT